MKTTPGGLMKRFMYLVSLAVCGVMMSSVMAAAATCFTCHAPVGSTTDLRPVDGAYRNISTGAFKGSHAKHMPTATTLVSDCAACHTRAASYTTKHLDGFIQVSSVRYSKGKSFVQSGSPSLTLGTCAAASCHDDGKGNLVTTPPWGTSSAACSVCHAVVPATGNHTMHLTGTNYKKAVCADCHNGTVQGVSANATDHRDGNIDVYKTTAGDLGYLANKTKNTAGGTCATTYCHSSGQSANGLSAVPVYAATAPTWGSTVACGSCHATTGMSTGSHAQHIGGSNLIDCGSCHTGATASAYNATTHVDGSINVASGFTYANQGTPGNGYSSCSATVCHGTGATPVWGAVVMAGGVAADTCTKCHGTPTATGTINTANRYLVAPGDALGNGTGKVSATAKTGAHETHLRYLNGLSQQGTVDDRCTACHGALPTSGNHASGSAVPAFQGLATKGGAFTASYTPATTTCAVYCHNPAGTGGTLSAAAAGNSTAPVWTDSTYISDTLALKSATNCDRCHLSPNNSRALTAAYSHATIQLADDCTGCHGHNGGTGGAAGQQHMDGVKYGTAACDACHGYPPVRNITGLGVAGNFANAKLQDYSGGGGHHTSHLLATVTSVEGFTPCLPCHPNATHNTGGGIVARANVNVFDAYSAYRFDDRRSKRYNRTAQTCSNASCHFQPTPGWY